MQTNYQNQQNDNQTNGENTTGLIYNLYITDGINNNILNDILNDNGNRSNSSSIDFSVLNFSQFNSPAIQPIVYEIQTILLKDFIDEIEASCGTVNKTFDILDDCTIREIFDGQTDSNSVKFEISKNIKIEDCLYDKDGNIMLLVENLCENRIYCDIIKNLSIRSNQYDNIPYKIIINSSELDLKILPISTTLSNDIKIKIEKDDIFSEINIHYVGYILSNEMRTKLLVNNIEDEESGYRYTPTVLNI
jgi:hypothetical protein